MSQAEPQLELLLFEVGARKLGVKVRDVRAVHGAVEILALPEVEGVVEGAIDVHGELVAVFDVRARLGLAPRSVRVSDRLIIVNGAHRAAAIRVDAALGIETVVEGQLETDRDSAAYLAGLARGRDGLVVIYDFDKFLSADEAVRVDAALSAETDGWPR